MKNAEEMQGNAAETASQMASETRSRAEDMKEQAGAQADAMLDRMETATHDRREAVASGLDRGAEVLHQSSDQARELGLKASEQLGNTGHRVAGGMENTAGYLHSHTTKDMAKSATTYAQKHPVATGVGALLTIIVFWRLMK